MASGGRGSISSPSPGEILATDSTLYGRLLPEKRLGILRILRQGESAVNFDADLRGRIIVIMGVSGSGKTTIGRRLAEDLGCTFLDGDDFHPLANIDKMSRGIPLSDEDREPWLGAISDAAMEILSAGGTAVVVCSALKKSYREVLRAADPVALPGRRAACRVGFVCLEAPASVIAARLQRRSAAGSHFMPAALLESQLALLRLDDDEEGILRVDSTQPIGAIMRLIKAKIFS